MRESSMASRVALLPYAIKVNVSTPMTHIVLLGDSIFDNGRYTMGGPDVISQVRQLLPVGFEFVNGFHHTANAVATVIYTIPWSPILRWCGQSSGIFWEC